MTMTPTRVTRAVPEFDPIPSWRDDAAVSVAVADAVPDDATVIGVPAFSDGEVPDRVPLDRATLEASGFTAERGETLVLPRVDGPTVIVRTDLSTTVYVPLTWLQSALASNVPSSLNVSV